MARRVGSICQRGRQQAVDWEQVRLRTGPSDYSGGGAGTSGSPGDSICRDLCERSHARTRSFCEDGEVDQTTRWHHHAATGRQQGMDVWE